MMTKTEAAKYFVVAWVKGWSLRMYLNTVAPERIAFDEAHDVYPWLPKDPGWFYRNQIVRRYIADAFPRFNDRLWDAKDNAARLALAPHIEELSGARAKQTVSDASKEMYKARREYAAVAMLDKSSIEAMRRGSGHHWNVVK